MKSQSAILGVALCIWLGDAVFLRAGNTTGAAAAPQKLTGLLCREPGTQSSDVDVVLEEGGHRSLIFSKNVKDSKGNVIGREVAGMQSTVHCAKDDDTQCKPADLDKPIPSCKEVGESRRCPCAAVVSEPLKLAYQQAMVNETLKLCEEKAKAKQPFRVLMFGLGGGTVPMYIRHRCEAALVDSVEVDARVALIAQRLFGFKADTANTVEIADGEEAAVRLAATHPWPAGPHYDVILVDCFDGDNHVAASCRSDRFLHSLRTSLGPDGLVLHNVMDADMKSVLPMYQATFGETWTSEQLVQPGQSLIVAKTHSNHPAPGPH